MAIETLDDIKKLSPQKKALALVIIYILLGYFFWFFLLEEGWGKMVKLTKTLDELKDKITLQERIVAQRDKHFRDVQALRDEFRLALMKLPERKEIPGLLESVASAGKRAGLEFVLFEPVPPPPPPPKAKDQKTPEAKKDGPKAAVSPDEEFYEIIPIKMSVSGRYHNLVSFFDRVARLPRIVNIDNIIIREEEETKGRKRRLVVECVLKAYMFKERKESK